MKIKKNDMVKMLSGKDRGKTGKVLRVFGRKRKLVVEGLNIAKRHRRPKKQGEKGQIVEIAVPVAMSKAAPVCPSCGKSTRVGYKMVADKKVRFCKKCGSEIDK